MLVSSSCVVDLLHGTDPTGADYNVSAERVHPASSGATPAAAPGQGTATMRRLAGIERMGEDLRMATARVARIDLPDFGAPGPEPELPL